MSDQRASQIAAARTVEYNRRRYILLFVSYIMSGIMLVLGVWHLNSQDIALQYILFGGASCFFLNALLFHWQRQLDLACLLQSVFATLYALTLVYHGGYHFTALYWVFPFPPILFGLLGRSQGIAFNALLFSGLLLLLFGPDFGQAQYPMDDSSRFLTSILTLMTATAISEHFRERSHHNMDLLQRSKEQQANTDALTGLANRRFVDAVVKQHLNKQAESMLPMAMILADIDHFKYINDSFGHAEGDKVLQQIALLFKQKLRQQDFTVRYGGEEFLLLLPNTSLEDAARVAEKIRSSIAQQRFVEQHKELVITCSFGVAMLVESDLFDESLLVADQQMYLAKAAGRNQVKAAAVKDD